MVTSAPFCALATTSYSLPGPERMFKPVSAPVMVPFVPAVTELLGGVVLGVLGVVGVVVILGGETGVEVPPVET